MLVTSGEAAGVCHTHCTLAVEERNYGNGVKEVYLDRCPAAPEAWLKPDLLMAGGDPAGGAPEVK